jgi:transcriptional regulator with XRE-family HTH domain
MNIKAILGANVKFYRKQRRISQEDLSEKLEIGPNHLSKIERGAAFVSAELLERLIQALGVSSSALFHSAEEDTCDNGIVSRLDRIIEQELENTRKNISLQLYRMLAEQGAERGESMKDRK